MTELISLRGVAEAVMRISGALNDNAGSDRMVIHTGDGQALLDHIAALTAERDRLAAEVTERAGEHRLNVSLLRRQAGLLRRSIDLTQAMLENDPNDDAADGVILRDVWVNELAAIRKDAPDA